MNISNNMRVVLLIFSFSIGLFLTLSNSWRLIQQRRGKDKATKRTAIMLCVGLVFVILFAVAYKCWLYGSAIASWRIDDLSYFIACLFSGGAIYVVVGVGSLFHDHVPFRKNINSMAFWVTGLGSLFISGMLFHRL